MLSDLWSCVQIWNMASWVSYIVQVISFSCSWASSKLCDSFMMVFTHNSSTLCWAVHQPKSHEVVRTGHWTTIASLMTMTKCILGLLHRHFYKHSDINASRELYVSLVQPHLEYAAAVWSPHLQKDIATLEKIQYFVARIPLRTGMLVITTFWTYLSYLNLHSRLCFMYKIVHRLLYFTLMWLYQTGLYLRWNSKRKHFRRLSTFWFSTFAMLFCATVHVVGHEPFKN